jgi:putative ABC transport system permease protein
MNDNDVKEVFGIKDEYSIIVVQVRDINQINDVAEKIKEVMRKDRDEKKGQEDFSVQTPEQAISSVKTILNIINAIVIGIAAISLIVGGIGIMNTMYTSVLERTREIGIMKAIGARNRDVLLIFLIESGLLGLVGGAIGIGIGFSIGKIVEYAAGVYLGTTLLRAVFPIELILGSLAFSFFIGMLSGVLPAFQASRLKPVEALRYE